MMERFLPIIEAMLAGMPLVVAIPVAVSGFFWLLRIIYNHNWSKKLSCGLHFSSSTAFEGETIAVTDILANNKWLPLPFVHVCYRISRHLVYLDNINKKIDRGELHSFVYFAGMKKTISRKSTVLCAKRGCYQIEGVSVTSNNPLMTGFLSYKPDMHYNLTVYPRHVEYPQSIIPFKKMIGETPTRRITELDPFTFMGIREYQPFDSFRQINWKATARTRTLMSNEYYHTDMTVTKDITIILNLQDYNSMYNRDFVHEEAIRIAAFLCREYIRSYVSVSLVCPAGDGRPARIGSGASGRHLETLYTALAHIDLTAFNAGMGEYLRDLRSDNGYVLISSYHAEDFCDMFHAQRSSGVDIFWIIPHCAQDSVTIRAGSNITKFEVIER